MTLGGNVGGLVVAVGIKDGTLDGLSVGESVLCTDGLSVGKSVGNWEGDAVGLNVAVFASM